MKLTVCSISYNQQDFVGATIAGIAMQQTNFDFEVHAYDDASKDATALRWREAGTSLKNFHLHVHPVNIGSRPNFFSSIAASEGEYIALCEGDDYWTDPLKLQKQVDFLDANPAYAICWTNGQLLQQVSGKLETYTSPEGPVDWEKLSKSNLFLTSSSVFRKTALGQLPAWLNDMPYGDWALYLHILHNSGLRGYCLPDISIVYRLHAGGIHGGLQLNNERLLHIYNEDLRFFDLIRNYHGGHDYNQLEEGVGFREKLISELSGPPPRKVSLVRRVLQKLMPANKIN